jgi:hypothetical protein
MPNPATFTHTMSNSFSRPGENLTGQQTTTGPSENCSDFTIAALASDELHVFTCDHTKKLSLWLVATAAMTVCVNAAAGGGPAATLTLVANVPVQWALASSTLAADPFGTVATTALYVTSTAGGTLKVRELENNV